MRSIDIAVDFRIRHHAAKLYAICSALRFFPGCAMGSQTVMFTVRETASTTHPH
jgi:hypothetical protein